MGTQVPNLDLKITGTERKLDPNLHNKMDLKISYEQTETTYRNKAKIQHVET